jgi:hypothetical protein
MGLASLAAARADPPSSRIAIGDITFNYKPASWRIVPEGNRLVATCLQHDCRGAVVDISRRQGEAGCTREVMVAEAERLFPAPRRAYANILRTGRFALVLAERNAGPNLSSPTFAYGCLAWEGSEYRFAMRPETVGTQSWIGGALHYLVSRATAPAAGGRQVRIGDIRFRASTEIWTVSDGTTGETLWLTCRMPTCHEPGQIAELSVRSPAQPCPPLPVEVDAFGGETMTITLINEAPDGPDFTISSTDLGCRNSVPPHFEACSVQNGRSYHLSVLGDQPGCRSSGWSIPEGALIDLLKSARMVQ